MGLKYSAFAVYAKTNERIAETKRNRKRLNMSRNPQLGDGLTREDPEEEEDQRRPAIRALRYPGTEAYGPRTASCCHQSVPHCVAKLMLLLK